MTKMDRLIAELSRIQQNPTKALNSGVSLQQGVVVSIDLGSLDVVLRGYSEPATNVRYLNSYTPRFGDLVWVLKSGADMICLGDLATKPTHQGFLNGVIEENPVLIGVDGPSFENSWDNHGSVGPPTGYNPAGYYRQTDGWVRLQGQLAGGSDSGTMFTLPEEFRPGEFTYATGISNSVACLIEIHFNGQVRKLHGGSNVSVSLEGIVFPSVEIWDTVRIRNMVSAIRLRSAGWQTHKLFLYSQIFRREDGWRWMNGAIKGGSAPGTLLTGISDLQPEDSVEGSLMIPTYEFGVGVGRLDVRGEEGILGIVKGGTPDRYLGNAQWWTHNMDTDRPEKFQFMQYWERLSYVNGWADYINTYWQEPSVLRDDFGHAHLRGMLDGASQTSGTFTTLSEGYRPYGRTVLPILKQDASGGIIGRLDVHNDGTAVITSAGSSWHSINGSYKAVPAVEEV